MRPVKYRWKWEIEVEADDEVEAQARIEEAIQEGFRHPDGPFELGWLEQEAED